MQHPTPGPTRPRVVETLPDNQPIWFISDLHLGDGTTSDVFFGKDRHLIALIDRVDREGAHLVICGDAIDFHQAWSFLRVLRAHQDLFRALSRLARSGRVTYIVGNHDYDISVFRDILNFRVCDELHIGERILARHGYEYDAYTSAHLQDGWHTKIHHTIERWLNTWVRIPLAEFYTMPNRLLFWLAHKIGWAAWLANQLGQRLGQADWGDELLARLDLFTHSNLGDSMGIFRPAWHDAQHGSFPVVLCGHSHLPGIVRSGDRAYANTGSWTFASSQYIHWDGERLTCADWITGRTYGDELYRSMLDGTLYERDFFQWWRENYMGLLRFREGEERRGRLRGWQTWLRDRQILHQLRPVPPATGQAPPGPRG